ncbi:MAG: orotidine 5'-phosphate decarboxylase [Planctomycetota bacterium]|jgi:3-hexulose-6-phosphate synthase / 6-phospho-3-hexuloisomerase|nr:orotidine 5'-phosphate decarboxylase [Planctomycetota bacterium]
MTTTPRHRADEVNEAEHPPLHGAGSSAGDDRLPSTPKLQVALDLLILDRALGIAAEAAAGGAEILEVGTPLLKSEGLDAVRALHEQHPSLPIVADTKTMDAGRTEMEMAAKAGASFATVLGLASNSTIRECVEVGKNYGISVVVDLVGHPDPVARAREAADLGAAIVGVHCPIDEQMEGKDPFDTLRAVRAAVDIQVAVAGGIHGGSAAEAASAGADIVIVGGAISKAPDARQATESLATALRGGIPVHNPDEFKRYDNTALVEAFSRVSTPNISDAMHRGGAMQGLTPLLQGAHVVGRAVTCRTYPGDWAKPVEAIDAAQPGDVLVIDAGGRPPAVWGELATESCIQRKIAAVIIDGAIRDVDAIRGLNFPAWSRQQVPNAWEPKGFGEIGTPIICGGQRVSPGDWIIGDDSGLVVVPAGRAVEVANRANDVLEMENRVRGEIQAGSTLSQVAQLYRWEKS